LPLLSDIYALVTPTPVRESGNATDGLPITLIEAKFLRRESRSSSSESE